MSLETVTTIRLVMEELVKNVNMETHQANISNFTFLIESIYKLLGELRYTELCRLEDKAEKYATKYAMEKLEAIKKTL